MQIPPTSTATGRLINASSFTQGRLNANKTAKSLLGKIEPQYKVLKAANLAYNDCQDAINMARGPVIELDGEAQEMLADLQLDAFKFVKKDRKDPLYVALLPKGLTALRGLAGADLQAELKRLADRLKDLAKEHPLHVYSDKCAVLQKAYGEPLKGLDAVKSVQAKNLTSRNQARLAWVQAYEGIYGALRAMFPGRRAFVETFFLKFSKGNGGNGGSGNGGEGSDGGG